MRPYELGNPELDRKIEELVAAAGAGDYPELIEELIVTALKLGRDRAQRGDLKLINAALKEMRYSMLVFSRYRAIPKVTLFGSARVKPDDPNFRLAHDFARLMAQDHHWDIVTGAGPGVMEAGAAGAGTDHTFGVSIRLPFEAGGNRYISPERTINFKYFFTRKLGFVKESSAFVLLPGGFGTMDETFELLTLVQTGKSDLHPVVMLEAEGTGYWEAWDDFVRSRLVEKGLISPADLNLYRITHDPAEAADEIMHFYSNYESQRYVDGRLILRLRTEPTPEQLERLGEEFADIVSQGTMEVIEATAPEVKDGDSLDSARLAFHFDRRSFGRLRQLVDTLNDLTPEEPEDVHPPPAIGEEQVERPW